MSLDLLNLLPPERVRVALPGAAKDDVLREMVALASGASAVVDTEGLLRDVLAREEVISTGVGQGLALPHARTEAVRETVAAFATLDRGVDYDALDGEPVRLVLLLAGPQGEHGRHLRLLSRISRVMSGAGTRQRLLAARTPRDVLDVIAAAESDLK